MHRLPVAFVSIFMVLSLTACKPQTQIEPVPVAIKQVEEAPKPSEKKLISVEEIDFSKYPGATKPAAFGFYFGLSQDQIKKAGVDLLFRANKDGLIEASSKSVPLPWANASSYNLTFFEDKLIKVSAMGENITSDSSGRLGREMYEELETALTGKYGKASKSFHERGDPKHEKYGEFYECLIYPGCGNWEDHWTVSDKHISLSLNGAFFKKGEEGYISISYKAAPEFKQAQDAIKSKQLKTIQKGL